MATFKTGYSPETGGTESLATATNYPTATTSLSPPVPGTYVFSHGWKGNAICPTYTLSGTPWITAHCLFRVTNASPAADLDFFQFEDGSGDCWVIRLEATPINGRLKLVDAGGTVQDTSNTGIIAANTWYRIDVKFKHSDSTDIEVWLSEAWKPSKKVMSDTSFDASSGGTTATCHTYNGVSVGTTLYTAQVMVFEDTETNMHDDRTVGRYRYFRSYQNTTQGSAVDFGSDALDSGNWSDAGETPANDANYGVYDVTAADSSKDGGIYCNDGARTGPSGDTVLGAFDVISGAIYVCRCRSADNFPLGERVKFTMWHGSSGSQGSTAWPLAIPGAWNQNSNRLVVLDGADADCPTLTEYAAIGAEADRNTADGSLWIGDMWVLVALERKFFATIDGLVTVTE